MHFLEVSHIYKDFPVESGFLKSGPGLTRALINVSFSVEEGTTMGVVGESGSGKTTLARVILDLLAPTSGEIVFDPARVNRFRKDAQIIFQNPFNSLSPKMRVLDAIIEPLSIHKVVPYRKMKSRAAELLNLAGLSEEILTRFPRELSGGQRQRVCIARALASEPKFIVLDEPISSLDLTVQARMLELFLELKEKFKLTYLFISHNLAVVKHIADTVIVMQEGRIVEAGRSAEIFSHPASSYTRLLLQSAKGKM